MSTTTKRSFDEPDKTMDLMQKIKIQGDYGAGDLAHPTEPRRLDNR